jgi:hypothetical protein
MIHINLARRIESLLPPIRLKHEKEFVWGTSQKEAFESIKNYLLSPLVLQAPRTRRSFRLYIATQDKVIGAVLTQEDGKEFAVAYVCRRLLEVETRYAHGEKICLTVYYACSKF